MDIETGYSDENLWPQIGAQYHHLDASVNRSQYVNPNANEMSNCVHQKETSKILINPNFTKKVFVNPNFNPQNITRSVIHVNTKIYNPKFLQTHFNNESHQTNLKIESFITAPQQIHVNPTVMMRNAEYLNNVLQNRLLENEANENLAPTPSSSRPQTHVHQSKYRIVKSQTKSRSNHKLNKSPIVTTGLVRKRRYSIKSLYKVEKSSPPLPISQKKVARKKYLQTTYKIVKTNSEKDTNKYKLDNTTKKPSNIPTNRRKFVYVNKFLSLGDLAKHTVIKKNQNLKMSVTNVKIGGLTYKKSPHSLKRTFSGESSITTPVKLGVKDLTISNKYKLVRCVAKSENEKTPKTTAKKVRKLSERSFSVRMFKIIRKERRSASPKKMKKCNIPCPFFKKYGICKANENGKCFRKHDPDQIALCTKFLQGACIKEKCRLSHSVLPEKMPTCKYYLEGSCSKDNCPYLHVKISPKAEICRDFVEGFCAKAAKCDKRHQYLCPDYEKYGKCPKQRCEYPHGIMVRNYYLENRNRFVKKHLNENHAKMQKNEVQKSENIDSGNNTAEIQVTIDLKSRYYEDKQISEINSETAVRDFRSRPKLGDLPAFIPFS